MYDAVEKLEADLARRVDLVVQVGDFGAWPDPARYDEPTRRHGDSGAFARIVRSGRAVPRPTVFIAGNHEDFDYLLAQGSRPIVPDLWFLRWGETFVFESLEGETLRLAGAGGCFGARDYERERLVGASRRHYGARDLRALAARTQPGETDVLLLHEPPAGVVTELHAPPGLRPRTWNLANEGLLELVAAVRPRVCFTGHIHARTERRIAGVRTVGLNKVAYRGSLIVLEVPAARDAPVRDLAEWGGAPGAIESDRDARSEPEAPEVPAPVDPRLLDALAARLRAWACVVLAGGAVPDRDARMRLHAALAAEPLRAAMMSALLGHDPRPLLERAVPPSERAALLMRWEKGALPDAARLRPS